MGQENDDLFNTGDCLREPRGDHMDRFDCIIYKGKNVLEKKKTKRFNTVVSNHFHSVNFFLFSSARSRDFDGTSGTELPVSMYTTKTPIDMCCFNVRSST